MRNKVIFIFAFLLMGIFSQAQILEDKAKFSDVARGKAIFELNRGEHFYTYEGDDGWYKARKMVYLKYSEVGDKRISAGTVFYNEDEEPIGQALEALKLYDMDTLKGFRSEPRIRAVIQGYVFETKIEESSIPEERIGEILAIKNRNEQQRLFKDLFSANEGLSEKFDDLEARVIFENNKVSSEEKDFRVIVVFRGSSPYAIITNDHTVQLEKVKEVSEDGDFTIYYFYKASASQKAKVEDLIYNFLAL